MFVGMCADKQFRVVLYGHKEFCFKECVSGSVFQITQHLQHLQCRVIPGPDRTGVTMLQRFQLMSNWGRAFQRFLFVILMGGGGGASVKYAVLVVFLLNSGGGLSTFFWTPLIIVHLCQVVSVCVCV